jgi:uncharacterized protein
VTEPARRAEELVRLLDLRPHPEGGHYREVFRSGRAVDPRDRRGARAALTHIYYLLAAGQHSRWHRVSSDEAWHFYEGDALELFWLAAAGTTHAGCWQAARLAPEGAARYVLVGCTVGPGFDFADFAFMAADVEAARALRTRFPELVGLL